MELKMCEDRLLAISEELKQERSRRILAVDEKMEMLQEMFDCQNDASKYVDSKSMELKMCEERLLDISKKLEQEHNRRMLAEDENREMLSNSFATKNSNQVSHQVDTEHNSVYAYHELESFFGSDVKLFNDRLFVYENSTKESLDLEMYGCVTTKRKRAIFNEMKEDRYAGSSEFTIDELTEMMGEKVVRCENRLVTYRLVTVDYLQKKLIRYNSHCTKNDVKEVLFERLVKVLQA